MAKKKQKTAFVFPGQGSQVVGMGRDLYQTFPAARHIFDQADEVLEFPLSRLCFEGPEEELKQTINTQPAVLTASIACLEAAREAGLGHLTPAYVAGHSLGEYTSLVAAGALDFPQAVMLVRERGRLMQEASQQRVGGMLAVLGLPEEKLQEVCQVSGAQVANFNCPGQIVLSGTEEALVRAREAALARGARRVIPLDVSGPFHSSLMRRALRALAEKLSSLRFRHPRVPIVANATAQALTSPEAVHQELRTQLCHPVRWQGSVEYMAKHGVGTFVELGPSPVLSGLIERTDPQVQAFCISDLASLEKAKLRLSTSPPE